MGQVYRAADTSLGRTVVLLCAVARPRFRQPFRDRETALSRCGAEAKSMRPGDSLGPYRVVDKLGEGGMGEVYRATDVNLKRQVAIKVLPASVGAESDRLARFQREAEVLASLNHPNIAAIYGLEKRGDSTALVMELVEGPTLADRIAQGAIPLDQAMPIARQIAEALEAAHEQGIVHRDLKPMNIKVRADATVKVLDFGLAKAMVSAAGSTSGDATMTSPALSEAGTILGTAAYMSPEQARGKAVDRRADIWAFGAVLYEMLTGRRLFRGETVSDLVAAVLRDDIDFNALPETTPEPVARLLKRCLDRDVKQRLQAIGEARVVFEEATTHMTTGRASSATATSTPVPPAFSRTWWLVAAGVLVVAAGAFALWQPALNDPRADRSPAQTGRSIAVLPFVNSSGNAADEYFADGMTDELISSLGRIPGLRVAARSSVFTFKGRNAEIREVARKLNVDSVLEGTVRRSGNRLRVTAALVSATDGLQMWSSRFENDGSDPFGAQDEITRGVVSGLSLQLSAAALAASQAGRTKDPEAHDLYLRALQAQNLASEADLRRALEFYQQAISRDPEFALAYAGIAAVHVFLADAYVAPIEAYPKAKAAAEAALQRDSQLAEGYAAKAIAEFCTDWNWSAADRDFSRALELNPNSVTSLFFRGTYLYFSGRPEQGRADLDRAARLDPLSPLPPFFQEFGSYVNGRYRDVIELHRKTQAIDPSFAYIDSWLGGAYRELGDYQASLREYAAVEKLLHGAPQYGLALTYLRLGRDRDARDVMHRLDEHARTHYVPYYLRAPVHAALGDMDTAVQLLRQAVDTREVIVFAFRQTPEMSSLLKDPRALTIYEQADAIRTTSSQRP